MSDTINYILDNLHNKSSDKHSGGGMQSPFKNIMALAGQTNQKIMNLIGGMGNMTSGYGKYVSMYMSMPCMFYQNMANAVCRLSGTGMFSPQNFMPQQQQQLQSPAAGGNDADLDENILNDIDEDNLDDDDEDEDSKEVKDIKIKQSGGSNQFIPTRYNYIVNPLTNRKVKIDSKKGKLILAAYLNNFGAKN